MITSDVAPVRRAVLVAVLVAAVLLTLTRRVWPAVLVAAAVAAVALSVHHYGDASTANQGYALDVPGLSVGWGAVGAPGLFGDVSTVLGSVVFSPAGVRLCAADDPACGP